MSRQAQLVARVAERVLRASKGRLSMGGGLALAAAAVVWVVWVQPAIEQRFGVALPTVVDVDAPPAAKDAGAPRSTDPGSTDSASTAPEATAESGAGERSPTDSGRYLQRASGRGVYVSPAGLRYTRGSRHDHRIAHVLSHTRDEPGRDGSHGVFDESDPAAVFALVDEAYEQALAGERTDTRREDGRVVYDVDLGRRIGYVGGRSGARRGNPAARGVRLVVQEDRLITAFPIRE